VLNQATLLDQQIDSLQRQLDEINSKIEQQNRQSNAQNIQSSLLLLGSSSSPAGEEGASEVAKMFKAKENIECIMSQLYETLKWVQGSALDLQFQTQEIEAKLNEHAHPL